MRTILIDPFAMTVTEYDLKPGLEAIYAAIGVDGKRSGFDTMRWAKDVIAFVDDFGMFKQSQRFWHVYGDKQMLAGRALIAGLAENGDTVALPDRMTCDLVQGHVAWLGSAENAERSIAGGMIERPETAVTDGHGNRTVVWRWTPAECQGEAQGEKRGNETAEVMARSMGLGEKQ